RLAHDVGGAADVLLTEWLAVEGRDRHGHRLDELLAAVGRDHDLFEAADFRVCRGRRFLGMDRCSANRQSDRSSDPQSARGRVKPNRLRHDSPRRLLWFVVRTDLLREGRGDTAEPPLAICILGPLFSCYVNFEYAAPPRRG